MNKKRLNEHLEKLNTFKTVADSKSVHKAAVRLGLTQPAVSRTLKVLETVLECRLMDRESRGMRLTPDGVRLYEYANLIEKTLESFDPLGDLTVAAERPLRIATYDNIACNIISGFSKNLILQFPALSIKTGGPNSVILGELIGGKHDCALMAQPRILAGLEYKKLYMERYGFFIAGSLFKKSELYNKNKILINDLKKFQIIAMPEAIAGVNKNIDRLLWDIGLKSPININSYEIAMQLAREGVGIAIMPYSTAWRDLQNKTLHELVLKDIPMAQLGAHELTLCWDSKQEHQGVLVFEKELTKFFSKI